MRLKHLWLQQETEQQVLAIFGEARLVRTLDGRLELRGGSHRDREEAQEWIERFMRPAASQVDRSHVRTTS
jgi:hypothetical protein